MKHEKLYKDPLPSNQTLLTVLEVLMEKRNHRTFLRVQCICGRIKDVREDHFKNKRARSCGCYRGVREPLKHGCSNDKLYLVWSGMLSRCYNKNNKRYPDYGGRGITVCEEWRNSYVLYKSWALNNGWAPGLQIDREENDGNYNPTNCRCVTSQVNNRNKRNNKLVTYNGKTKTIPDWSVDVGISSAVLHDRLSRGWDTEIAFTYPVSKSRKGCIHKKKKSKITSF